MAIIGLMTVFTDDCNVVQIAHDNNTDFVHDANCTGLPEAPDIFIASPIRLNKIFATITYQKRRLQIFQSSFCLLLANDFLDETICGWTLEKQEKPATYSIHEMTVSAAMLEVFNV